MSVDGTVIPEYWCYANGKETRCALQNGAKLYKVTQDGEEILWAVYDESQYNPISKQKGIFVRLEDIKKRLNLVSLLYIKEMNMIYLEKKLKNWLYSNIILERK